MAQEINQFLCRVAKMLGRNVCVLIDNHINREGLAISRGQMFVFLYIANHPGTTQKEITKRLCEEKPAVAKAVKKLNTMEYIHVERQTDDKRLSRLYLTAAGEKERSALKKILKKVSDVMKADLDDAEVSAFFNLLLQVNENVRKALDRNTRRQQLEQIENQGLDEREHSTDFISAYLANDIRHARHGDF